jgi:hypothetical protein
MTEWHIHLLIYSSDVPTHQTYPTHLTYLTQLAYPTYPA